MPTLAGWLTGEQVPQEVIEQTLSAMGAVLGQHGGQPMRMVQPGAGLITFSEAAHAMQHNLDPPVLDWVPERRTLVYRRPLAGTHMLYYIENWPAEGNLLFASEIKALLAVGAPRHLHLAALDALLRYGFIPAPWTAFQDIQVVPAGSILRWQRAKTVVNTAVDYTFANVDEGAISHKGPTQPPSPLQISPAHLLNQTVAAMLPPHDQLVALTGGGTASALAISLASQQTSTPFTIATYGYKKSESEAWEKAAEEIASAFERPFLAITEADQPEFWVAVLTALETPTLTSMPLALHQLLHTTAQETGARVAISGLGGHTLLGERFSQVNTSFPLTMAQAAPVDVLHQYAQVVAGQSGFSDIPMPTLWSQDAMRSIQEAQPWEETLYARKLVRKAAHSSEEWQHMYYLDLHLRLPDLLVSTAQQLATAEGLVLRSPYLAPDVMDALTRLPATLEDGTLRPALFSTLLKHAMPQRVAHTSSPLVAPTGSLLHINDSDLLQQTLSEEALRTTGIFDLQAVQGLLERGESEQEASRELLFVFTTQLFCQLFGVNL